MAKTVYTVGINIEYNHQFVGYCKSFENVAVIFNNSFVDKNNPLIDMNIMATILNCGQDITNLSINDNEIEQFKTKYGIYNVNKDMFRIEQFSLIIGCDGTKSRVRNIYKMGWYQQNTINIGRFLSDLKERMEKNVAIAINNLYQLSLLVNFKTIRYSNPILFDENNHYSSHNCPQLT